MVEDNRNVEDAQALVAFAESYLRGHLSSLGGVSPRLVWGGDASAVMRQDIADYPQLSPDESVLLIVSEAPSRSRADRGVVVTTWGVHWKTSGGSGSRPWSALERVVGGYGRLGSKVHLDAETVLLRLPSADEISLLLGFVVLVAEGSVDVQPNDAQDPTPTLRLFGTTEGLIPCPRCSTRMQLQGPRGTYFCGSCQRSFTPSLSKALKKLLKDAPKVETHGQPIVSSDRDKQLRKVSSFEEERARKLAALGVSAEPQETSSDVADALKQLGELHAAGVLTDEEFAAKKEELLRRM